MANQLGMLIDNTYIRLLYARTNKKFVKVSAYEKYSLDNPFDIHNPDSFRCAQAHIDHFVKKYKIKKKEILLLIQSDKLIINEINVPYSSKINVVRKIASDLESFFPFDVEDYSTDFRMISVPNTSTDTFIVLILGLPNILVQSYLRFFEAVKYKPSRFDVTMNALLKAFASQNKTRIVIDISTELFAVLFLQNGLFLRYQTFYSKKGWNYFVQAIAEGLSFVQKTAADDYIAEEIVVVGTNSPDEKLISLLSSSFSMPINKSIEQQWLVCEDENVFPEVFLLAAAMRGDL